MVVSFKEARRLAKTFRDGDLRIAVVGDCATQFLVTAIKGLFAQWGICGKLFEADYNQVTRQILLEDSELRIFNPDMVIVWETAEHWWMAGDDVDERLARVEMYAKAVNGKLLYVNMAALRDGVFGNYAGQCISFSAQVRAFNTGLDALTKKCQNLFVVDFASLVADYGRASLFDATTFMLSDMVLTPDGHVALARQIVDIVTALLGRITKCVVVDLDNTLWGGVIGEDGLSGIAIGNEGIGKAYANLQRLLKRLKERGILLAVCSKNDEAIAREPFEKHPDMLLRLEDFACFVANWETKADNIAHIQRILNIGMDSLVFLDDNPAERAIIRVAYPQVRVPELPQDASTWIDFLARENVFETVSYSENDATRTRQYQIEAARQKWEASFTNENDFLKSLEMTGTCKVLDDFTIPRAAQLTQRSNQFNLRTVRYSENELRHFAEDRNIIQLGFTLADRFGSHGLVSVVIGKVEGDALFLDTWLMSCRVLKRGLEFYVLNKIVSEARSRGLLRLIGEYRPTPKNSLVKDLYATLGFKALGDGRYELDLLSFTEKETPIHESTSL